MQIAGRKRTSTRRIPWLALILFIALSSQFIVTAAYGQAWVPRKRTGSVSIIYKNLYVRDHTTVTGKRFNAGQIYQNVALLELDYGISRRLAVNLSLPLVFAKYSGNQPHRDEGQVDYIDDGSFHGGSQDLRVGFRYHLVRERPLDVTPFIEGIFPTRDYPTFGHALIGRNLLELLVGTNVGRDLSPLLPNVYVQTRASYAFVERVMDISHNRANLDSQIDYLLTERLALSILASIQKHFGGLTWIEDFSLYSHEEWHNHTQLFRSDAVDVGAGLSFRINADTAVFANVITTSWSKNSHPLNRGVIVGVSRSFHTKKRRPPLN